MINSTGQEFGSQISLLDIIPKLNTLVLFVPFCFWRLVCFALQILYCCLHRNWSNKGFMWFARCFLKFVTLRNFYNKLCMHFTKYVFGLVILCYFYYKLSNYKTLFPIKAGHIQGKSNPGNMAARGAQMTVGVWKVFGTFAISFLIQGAVVW